MVNDGIKDEVRNDDSTRDRWLALGVAGLLVGTFLELLRQARYVVPLQTDDLIYHLSIPATWLQSGWLTPFTPWFHEPAPAYGPVLVEMLTAAMMALTGGEFWARLVLLPFQIGVVVLTHAILRRLDVPRSTALIVAAGTLVLRPFLLQTLSFHNDVALTCAFLLAVWGWLRGPIRVQPNGATLAFVAGLGLMLSIKYVAVIYALVLVAGAALWRPQGDPRNHSTSKPLRAAVAWAGLTVLMLLGCWTFLRTWWITGNPMYPVEIGLAGATLFPGLYSSGQVADYAVSWPTIIGLFVSRTEEYTLPTITGAIASACMLIVGLAALIKRTRGRSAQWVTVGILPVGCTLAFLALVPFGEPRLLFPVYALIWMAPAICIARAGEGSATRRSAAVILVALLALMAAWEGPARSMILNPLSIATALVAVTADRLVGRLPRGHRRRVLAYASCALALALGGMIYVYGPAMRTEYARSRNFAVKYGDLGRAWDWLEEATEKSPAVIAFAGTSMRYPLFGGRLQNRAVYVHVAPGNHSSFHEYGVRLDSRHRASAIALATSLFRSRFDQDYWLQQIAEQGVDYLLVVRERSTSSMPIEADWAMQPAGRFQLAFDSADAKVFRVLRAESHGHP